MGKTTVVTATIATRATNELGTFHDATLLSVHLEWPAGTLVITLATMDGPVQVKAAGLQEFECARLSPWGESVSVHEARLGASGEGAVFELQMQSGDVLTVRAAHVDVTDVEPGEHSDQRR